MCVIPMDATSIGVRTVGMDGGNLLPVIGVRTFDHHAEIAVTDLAGHLLHTIVIRQNGDVEVDA